MILKKLQHDNVVGLGYVQITLILHTDIFFFFSGHDSREVNTYSKEVHTQESMQFRAQP